jgi:opacity protein-like surface antigen
VGISTFALAAAGAALGLSGAAHAAVPATADAAGRALILVPLKLTKIDDLDFGSVIPSALSGVVTINAKTGERTFAGGVTGASSDEGNRALFGGAGSPNQQVIVTVDPPLELTNTAGDTVAVLGMPLDGPAIRSVDPDSRAFFVGIGGTLLIEDDQPDGQYSADFVVTANYQ